MRNADSYFKGSSAPGGRLRFLVAFLLFLFLSSGPASGQEIPRRIISHLPSFTEALFALGLGDSVVGISDYCNYPPEATGLPRVGGPMNTNFEGCLILRPDLAILHVSQKSLKKKYDKVGIATLVFNEADTEDFFNGVREIARVSRIPERAEEVIGDIHRQFETIRESVKDKKPVRTLIVIGHQPGALRNLYVAAGGSFHDYLLKIAGGKNVIEPGSIKYPNYSKEAILAANPEVILLLRAEGELSSKTKQELVALWEPLSYLTAVKNKRIVVLPGDYIMIPGTRMWRIARDFAEALHKQ